MCNPGAKRRANLSNTYMNAMATKGERALLMNPDNDMGQQLSLAQYLDVLVRQVTK